MSIHGDMNRFASNPVSIDISRSLFNMDHDVKLSGNAGELLVVDLIEVLPGDTFNVSTSKVVRLQPLVSPIMDTVVLDLFWHFVPSRLVWSHWKAFWGENESGAWYPLVDYTVPQIVIPSGGFDVGTIADYLGVPPKVGAGEKISALPFRCYAKICEDWFRDENLMNPVNISVGDTDVNGVNTGDQVTDIQLGGKPFQVCKTFDYFTACLPGSQKAAGPSVEFALRGLLPVYPYENKATINSGDTQNTDYGAMRFLENGSTYAYPSANRGVGVASTSGKAWDSDASFSSHKEILPNNLFADLNNTSVFDINSLRSAFAIQRYYEKLARGGSRYVEFIKTFFNVDSPDYRLQRSEYLGGCRIPLNVSDSEQTSASQSGMTPQGHLVGVSRTGNVNDDFVKSFTEHGYLICTCCLRVLNHTYQQGIDRTFLRKTKFDYYNPTFANLSEQGVFTRELYFGASASSIFGYQEAWADYRFKPNLVKGEMRSVATTPLDMWHLADNYASQPYLSDSWIREDKAMLDRCLAVTSAVSNQFFADIYIKMEASRAMPLYSIPGLIDHH